MGSVEREVERRELYLEAVVTMQRRLLTTTSDELGALNHVLEPLAVAAGASRVYLFWNHDGPDGVLLMSQRAEYCAPGIEPELHNPILQNLAYDDFVPRWSRELSAGRPINSIIAETEASERELLEPQGILSILVIPFQVDGAFKGFIGFDNCEEPRLWDDLEVNLLSVAATNIGLMLDQRRTQRELERMNAELADARDAAMAANESKSIFLAKVSHELRTPLNVILGYSEILIEDADSMKDGEWVDDVRPILNSGRHLLSVINDLLDISSAEAGKLLTFMEPFDADELVAELVETTRMLGVKNDNAFHAEVHGILGEVHSDEIRVRQILLNLLSNAFKYTSKGEVTLRASGDADEVVFAVEDTGIGMDPDRMEHIFDAFVQADDSPARLFEGTGLGLTIVKHLSDILGATLEVESAMGEGSCFTVRLPREHDEGA